MGDEDDCKFFFHITSTSGCILYNSCDETRIPAYSGTTVEIIREEPQRRALTTADHGLNVIYYQTKMTCLNGDQKISQPCNGGKGTGCSYDACNTVLMKLNVNSSFTSLQRLDAFFTTAAKRRELLLTLALPSKSQT